MKEAYFSEYYDLKGNIKKRKKVSQGKIVFFAGTKYLFDRFFSSFLLILISPILLIISIAIKLDSRGPVLFKQIRTGKLGKKFYMYKFRSMVANNDVRDLSKEDEYTKVGKFIRRLSLDELPQLINIVKGDMSFIGPRPWIPEYYDNMNEIQRHRCDVRPGISGLAQVMGRNEISVLKKIEYDLEYIKNYSMLQDFIIVLLTIKTIFTGKGADVGKTGIQNELEELKKENKKNDICKTKSKRSKI